MNKDNTEIFVASPGTGKTTRLMDILGELLEQGVSAKRIVYTTMSRAGSSEGRERAIERFSGLSEAHMPYFNTLHSIGYRSCPSKDLIKKRDFVQIGSKTGFFMTGTDGSKPFAIGNKMMVLENTMRLKQMTPEEAFMQDRDSKFALSDFIKVCNYYQSYKTEQGIIDFTDMILDFVKTQQTLPVDYLFIDEAQDSSKLQWDMLRLIGSTCKKVWVAGDDKQCIYEFAGADSKTLIELPGKRTILDQSYRIPRAIHVYAEAIAARIKVKADYTFKPREAEGLVKRLDSVNKLPLEKGTWLLIARHTKALEAYEHACIDKGMLFTSKAQLTEGVTLPTKNDITAVIAWNKLQKGGIIPAKEAKILYGNYLPARSHVKYGMKQSLKNLEDDDLLNLDKLVDSFGLTKRASQGSWDKTLKLPENTMEYLKKVEATEGLLASPRIEINTIHAVKGKEADNVAIIPDLNYLSDRSLKENPDTEHRIFYVGATRAKEALFLLPKSKIATYGYPI